MLDDDLFWFLRDILNYEYTILACHTTYVYNLGLKHAILGMVSVIKLLPIFANGRGALTNSTHFQSSIK